MALRLPSSTELPLPPDVRRPKSTGAIGKAALRSHSGLVYLPRQRRAPATAVTAEPLKDARFSQIAALSFIRCRNAFTHREVPLKRLPQRNRDTSCESELFRETRSWTSNPTRCFCPKAPALGRRFATPFTRTSNVLKILAIAKNYRGAGAPTSDPCVGAKGNW